jgi:hypothetical protein
MEQEGAATEPADRRFASRPKDTLNTTMVKNGWMTAQAAPRAVCL